MKVTLFGNRTFVNVIKLREGHTGLGWVPDWCPYKTREIWTQRQAQREDGHVMTQTDSGVMRLQGKSKDAKDC